jgi:DNA-binding MarR family transcriptional regulator
LVREWRAVRPDLDFSPVAVVSRLRRVRAYLDASLERTLAACGLSSPVFAVLSTLRRQGPPFELGQRALMHRLALTSGTVSVRVDQLVQLGLVTRRGDPSDRRGALVRLTEQGLATCDACTPRYVQAEERLLSALGPDEQRRLADLLRTLLGAYESEGTADPAGLGLGLVLAPSHVARERQRELGLAERTGLLVRAVVSGSAADTAGLAAGDLLICLHGQPLRSSGALADALQAGTGRLRLTVLHGAEPEREVELAVPSA